MLLKTVCLGILLVGLMTPFLFSPRLAPELEQQFCVKIHDAWIVFPVTMLLVNELTKPFFWTPYSPEQLGGELVAAGFAVERLVPFNRAGTPGWYLNGRILRRTRFNPVQMKLFNQIVPILRHVDRRLPWPALSLIAVARATEA